MIEEEEEEESFYWYLVGTLENMFGNYMKH
jgi:hypothetical protein